MRYRRQGGFTIFELIVVAAILAVLAGTLLNRVLLYQEQAEKTAMVEVEGAIQTALILQYGRLLVNGMASKAPGLATENPVNWLSRPPRNYVGEFYDPRPDRVAKGNWMFDLKSHELIYVVDRTEHFVPGEGGEKWVRFRVRLQYEPSLKVPAEKELTGAVFEPVQPYQWGI